MINKRTVFVLGAGASAPYGYPTGFTLRNTIIDKFRTIYYKFGTSGLNEDLLVDREILQEFVEKFDKSSTNSIDLFLQRHLGDESQTVMNGKLAIVSIMLHSETKSKFDYSIKDSNKEDWYNLLFEKMTSEMRTKYEIRFSSNQVKFITFNYDRSLEYFLHKSLTNAFPKSLQANLEEELRKIEFIHIHGRLPYLPWEENNGQPMYDYRHSNYSLSQVHGLLDNIRIVGEQTHEPTLSRAREILTDAERIFFLGFGHAKENILALGIPASIRKGTQIYGTALNSTKREIADACNLFSGLSQVQGKFKLADVDCRSLLDQFLRE